MRVLVGPLEAVASLCEAHAPSHLVSWLSPPATVPELPAALAPTHRLHLSSHDVAETLEGYDPPAAAHVARLLEFAAGWSGERPLLVHCWAGVSRSTAAAFAIACLKRPDVAEQALAWRLRRLSPSATPNPLIVRLADDLLGRGGRMSQAVAAIGRGREAVLGTPFSLDLRPDSPQEDP